MFNFIKNLNYMKKIICSFLFVTSFTSLFSQAVFWTETFGVDPGSCANKGQLANGLNPSGVGTWTVVSTGLNEADDNQWYISATEAGLTAGSCGKGCIATPTLVNQTLHIGVDVVSLSLKDEGTLYSAGPGTETHKRAESPKINCTSQSTISLVFLYFVKGSGAKDYFDVQYSPDAGTTWTVIATPPPTAGICPGIPSSPGLWTSYTVALPASANNNANVKIGFNWQNLAISSGADPAVAIDNIQLKGTATPTTPAFTAAFTMTNSLCTNQSTTLTANTGTFSVSGYTWSAAPSGAVFSAPNASVTSVSFPSAGTYTVTLSATSGTSTASSSNTVAVSSCSVSGLNSLYSNNSNYKIFPNPTSDKLFVQGIYASEFNVEVTDALGKIVVKQKPMFNSDNNAYVINVNMLPEGVYFIKIATSKETTITRFIKQ